MASVNRIQWNSIHEQSTQFLRQLYWQLCSHAGLEEIVAIRDVKRHLSHSHF